MNTAPTKKKKQAPDIALVNDVYHLYYTVSTFGTQTSAIGLATSPSMDPGSWTDHGETGVSSSEGSPYNAIDANLFIDGQTPYVTFGSFWTDLFQVPMNADATLSTGEPYNVAFEPEGTHPLEGPFVFRFGDWTYLFFMWGVCCGYDAEMPPAGQEYKVKVCRSERVDGGFVCFSFPLFLFILALLYDMAIVYVPMLMQWLNE